MTLRSKMALMLMVLYFGPFLISWMVWSPEGAEFKTSDAKAEWSISSSNID